MTKIANNSATGPNKPRGGVNNRTIQQRRQRRPFQDKGVSALPAVDWTTVELKEFRKCFVDVTKTPAKKYTEANIAKFYVEAEARASGPLVDGNPSTIDLKAPYGTLKETPFPAILQSELIKQGISKPVPLQSICWPYIMSGRNFVGVAPSGNDKLLTYVLPAVVHVADQLAKAPAPAPVPVVTEGTEEEEAAAKPDEIGPIAVILTNLKKRGEQIMECLKPYQTVMNVTSHFIFGGTEKKKETEPDLMLDGLKENPNILVVALGQKFSDLLTGNQVNLKKCTFMVLDDAGRIAKNVRYLENVFGQVRNDRQLIMWTVSYGSSNNAQDAIKHTTKYGFDDYARIDFGAFGQFHNPNTVKQLVDPVEAGDRDKRFIFLVQTLLSAASVSSKKPKLLVFCSSGTRMKKVGEVLLQTGLLSKSFYTKNPILPPAAETTGDEKKPETEGDAAATTTTTPEAETKVEEAETVAPAETEVEADEEEEDDTPQYDKNETAIRDNPLYNIWIANDGIPLDELNFKHFDFIINYDFPAANCELYEQRVVKYKAEGKGTIFSFILDSKTAKYVSAYMLESHQYVPPKMIDDKKNQANATQAGPPQSNKSGPSGGPPMNRPPSLLQKNPMRNGGSFGGPRPGPYNSGPPGRFGGGQKFNGGNFQNYGGNRGGFNRNGPPGPGPMGGGGGPGGPRNFGGPAVMDALHLLNQLRNQGGNNSFDSDNNYRNSNSFNSRNNYNGNTGGGGGGSGGGWFKDDGGRYNNFNNRNNF